MLTYHSYTDQELVELLQQGDRSAYAEIYNKYVMVLLAHANNKLRDREAAKDIVQEIFTMLWHKRETLEMKTNLSGYLYAMLRNTILNQISREGLHRRWLDSMVSIPEQYSDVTDHLIREKQLAEMIELEIANLPKKMRMVFELSRNEHLSHKEIAERLGITELTVSSHITHALKILKGKLSVMAFMLLTQSL